MKAEISLFLAKASLIYAAMHHIVRPGPLFSKNTHKNIKMVVHFSKMNPLFQILSKTTLNRHQNRPRIRMFG